MFRDMKQMLLSLLTAMVLAATTTGARADCYADYKAKRDNPLKLHYGVARIDGSCDKQNAANQLRPRLAADRWILLNVLSVFDETGLNQRKDSAGSNFLRF